MNRMIFAASCVECVADRLQISAADAYKRMKHVNLIEGYILKHYDAIHSESRGLIIDDILGCLHDWEQRENGKEEAQ